MPATRKLLLLSVVLYALLPLPWVVWRPEGLFYRFELQLLPQIGASFALFAAGWFLGERLAPMRNAFAADTGSTPASGRPVGVAATMLALLISAAANTALYLMGALSIDEVTGRERVPVLSTLASAHIFALIYSGCLLLTASAPQRSRGPWLLCLASIAMTIGVGLLEGRRTAVVLPIIVFLALALIAGRRALALRLLWFLPVFVGLFALTTYLRVTTGDVPDLDEEVLVIAGDAVVGRLGNALLVLDPVLDHMQTERVPLDPRTPYAVLAQLPNFGLLDPPFETGFGNEFGRSLGLLPDDNDFTGINSGWIGELLLLGGLPAVFVGGAALGMLAAGGWHLVAAAHPAGLFLRVMVVIFIVSGFQMEVAFPIGSLLRAALIALVIAGAERAMRRAFARR